MEFLHIELPCPACDAPVHVVVDPAKHRSRWCCIPCGAVGEAPFAVELPPTPPVPRAVASA
jgi:hypothetical protein